MAILGVDYGEKRVGLAISREELIAEPLVIIQYSGFAELLEKLSAVIEKEDIVKVVVGIPYDQEEKEGFQAQRVKDFLEELKKLNVEIIEQDEMLTSAEAEESLKKVGYNKQEIKDNLDKFAAKIILQDYLDQNRK